MLLMVKYELNHDQKLEAFKAFASMTAADDAALDEAYGVRTIGQWHDTANGRGVAIFEAESAAAAHGSLLLWAGVARVLEITPVLDNEGARKVINAFIATQ